MTALAGQTGRKWAFPPAVGHLWHVVPLRVGIVLAPIAYILGTLLRGEVFGL